MKNLLFLLLFATTISHAQTDSLGTSLKYIVQQPEEKTAHPPVVIFLHGYGANEQDLFGLRNMLFPKNFLVISARAPLTLSHGSYQWYELSMINGRREGNPTQAEASRKLILTFIDELVKKYNAGSTQVYLVGFSQGAIMSYFTALTAPEKVHGISILSGKMLPNIQDRVNDLPALKKLNIFAGHGTSDQMIPLSDGQDAINYVKSLGLQPEWHTYEGMGHSIGIDEIRDLKAWFAKLQTGS